MPGADAALALAFLNCIIEQGLYDHDFVGKWTHGFKELAIHVKAFTPERMATITRVPAAMIRKGAELFARSQPAAILWGNPIEHNAGVFDTARAIVC